MKKLLINQFNHIPNISSQKLHQSIKYCKGSYSNQNIFLSPKKKNISNAFQHSQQQPNQKSEQQMMNDIRKEKTSFKETLLSKNEAENKYEDIHSKRFIDSLKLEEGNNSEDFLKNEGYNNYSFVLERPQNAIKLDMSDLNIVDIENESTFHKTPKLAHNLDFILNHPGRVFSMEEVAKLQKDNGDFLRNIPQANQIDFDGIPPYIPPSSDDLLLHFARESQIKYVMSTSTISSVLAQIFYLFSSFKNPRFDRISSAYDSEPKKYMISQRKPITNFIRKFQGQEGIYAMDSDPGLFRFKNQILMNLGKIMENQLCLEPENFWKYLGENRDKTQILDTDHHRFMKLNNNICLRSQIDCYNYDQQGNPFVFEIKTRALCPIRYDLPNYQDYLDYDIKGRSGIHSSFEREYYDMIRGAFLKYTFQLKIGRMDGAFIAYHNTKQNVGFEYVKVQEIEKRVFGNETYSEAAFVICSKLLTTLLDNILADLQGEKYEMLKIGYYSCSHFKRMIVFVELFEETTKWGSDGLLDVSDDIKDEYDYYTKHLKKINKVIKYEFSVYPYINGVYQRNNNFFLNQFDQIDIEYKFRRLGNANFLDYMNFLHEAYKFDSINLDLNYIGAWVKAN